MVLALQGYNILKDYGSGQAVGRWLPDVLRELGPVVAALLFAGRRFRLTAEIGLMKATEQIKPGMIGVTLSTSLPRLWAGFIAMPLLA